MPRTSNASILPVLLLSAWLAFPALARAQAYIWVDETGTTHLTDDPSQVPAAARAAAPREIDELRALWSDGLLGPVPPTPPGSSSSDRDRALRLLGGAMADLRRGERARASATLRSALRLDPTRAEAHWYLALMDRERGRFDGAEKHLQAFLSGAGEHLAPWRASAERRLAALADERRLADESRTSGPLRLLAMSSPHFRIQMDSELVDARSEYAETVLRYLEEARREVGQQLGVAPLEPLGVVFYGKAAYVRAHSHRFSFQTVGFFDGRIHVSSPAHPSGGLRSLLFHEYTHALFREQTSGDRPYWLNEGLAEQVERRSRRQPASTRSERVSLRTRISAGQWISLRQLGPGFSGLDDESARAAYLEAILAAAWIEAHTDREQRARLLQSLGEGYSTDQALYEVVGLDVSGLDEALREEIRSEFPEF